MTALGREGEPAIRLASVREDAIGAAGSAGTTTDPEFTTIGYAVRQVDGWEWLSKTRIRALEEAAEARLATPSSAASIGGVRD